ncbi:MAG: putative Ca2+/H+ antiporter (TMEM165/GDT1 family) [Oceanicoccus sp.]|jgi:putative Ca2+/H+ antiporter (TMEM165/GDT1 family)
MEPLFISTTSVALAEIGDKTQLLSLLLATRFSNKWAIIAGILLATIINHGLSAWLGQYSTQWLDSNWLQYLISGSFIVVGLWVLIPDKLDDKPDLMANLGPFIATTVLFFLAEIGDKTQIATVILGAQYQNLLLVTIGTTIGMLLANIPVIYFGEALMKRLPLHIVRAIAAAIFISLGLLTCFWSI